MYHIPSMYNKMIQDPIQAPLEDLQHQAGQYQRVILITIIVLWAAGMNRHNSEQGTLPI